MKNQTYPFHRLKVTWILSQFMMDQMINQLKLQNLVDTWKVLLFQVLEIPYLSNLIQIGMMVKRLDFLQQFILVNHMYLNIK